MDIDKEYQSKFFNLSKEMLEDIKTEQLLIIETMRINASILLDQIEELKKTIKGMDQDEWTMTELNRKIKKLLKKLREKHNAKEVCRYEDQSIYDMHDDECDE